MSFLAPLFLLALPLLAIPIALHLWRKRRRETLPWGAMQFLINDDHQQRRFSNIDRWLVLIARCLALLFLIFALCRPLLYSERYGSLDFRTDDILVIDQSMSAARLDDQGRPLIETIRAVAKEWVRSRSAGANPLILTSAGRPEWLYDPEPGAKGDHALAIKRIDSMRPVAARSDLSAALRFAVTTDLDRDDDLSLPQRRVWVLTDGQASDWNLATGESVKAFCAELQRESDVEINIGIASVNSKQIHNVGLGPLTSDGWRKAPGERLRMATQIVNYGSSLTPASTAVWYVGKREISREPVGPLAAGESKTVEANVVLNDAGTHVVACELEIEDSLQGDNRSDAVVETLNRVPVLLVTDRQMETSRLGDAGFFAAALGHRSNSQPKRGYRNGDGTKDSGAGNSSSDRAWNSVFDVTVTTRAKLGELSLEKYDAVVIFDSGTLPSKQMQRLTDFVHRGGGLWLFLGDQTEVDSFNRDWYAGGLGLAPVALRSLVLVEQSDSDSEGNANRQGDPNARLHPPERDHPAVQWLSDSAQTDLNEVLIQRFYDVHRPESNLAARVLLRTGGGRPIGMLSNHGKGRVILQTLPMDVSWTNWPLTGSFVVMVDSWLRHLTEPRRSVPNLNPGSPFRLRIPNDQIASKKGRLKTDVVTPHGDKVSVFTVPLHEVKELRFSQTFESGVYQVNWQAPENAADRSVKKQPMIAKRDFSVRRPTEESQLASLSAATLDQFNSLGNTFVQDVVSQPEGWIAGGHTTSDDAVGDRSMVPSLPIWTPLLYGLLGLLLVELLLSGFASIRRFGRHTSADDDTSFAPTLDSVDLPNAKRGKTAGVATSEVPTP